MKIIKYLFILLITGVVFTSCKKEEMAIMSQNDAFVKFRSTDVSCSEIDATIKVIVDLSDVTRDSDVTVNFDFSVDGITNPAVEGTDFTLVNSSKTLTFKKGVYQDTITIITKDNSLYTKSKQIDIKIVSNSAGYNIGLNNGTKGNATRLTIVDDEHPLGIWIGTYNVAAASYNKPGEWDEAWNGITVASHPDNESYLVITGIAGSTVPVIAIVDKVNKTITISAGTDIGNVYNNGATLIFKGLPSGGGEEADVVGTINDDGNMQMDMSLFIGGAFAPANLWDSFNSTWTKQ